MTPTEQDKELRAKVFEYVEYFNEMGSPEPGQDGWYITFDNKMDELMQLITADRKRVALEARIDELEKTQRDFVHDESSEAFDEGRLYEQFLNGQLLAELTKDVTNPPK